MPTEKHAQRRAMRAEAKERARYLRSMGYSFRQIAKQLNIPRATAHYRAAGVQIILRQGTGWPNRKPWPKETTSTTMAYWPYG